MTGVPHIEGRWWGSTSASIAAHAALLTLIMLIATRVTNISDPPLALSPSALIFIPDGGARAGGGGGGDSLAQPPRPAQSKRASPTTMPRPSEAVQPLASVPAITTNAVETMPGAVTSIDEAGTSAGKGDGPGGGSARGPGDGPRDGPGVGDGPYLPGNGVSDPVLIREVKPNYTADALRAKIQGIVQMEAVVRADGTVDPRSIRIIRSLDSAFGLDREAIKAVQQWRFSPAMRKGQAVAVLVTLELSFTLR